MTTVENQKTITTRNALHDKTNLYAKLNIYAAEEAMNLLTPSTFKLWFYLAKNQNDYTFALSCVDACRFCKISASTFHNGIKELEKVGYLANTQGNHYDFYEKLPEEKDSLIITKKP